MTTLVIASILIALIITVLAVPWTFLAQGSYNQGWAGKIQLSWFRILSVEMSSGNGGWNLAVGTGSRQYRRPFSPGHKKTAASGKPRPSGINRTMTAISTERIQVVWSYLPRFSRALRLQAAVSGIYGTGDPAETGTIFGLLTALRIPRIRLDLKPDFLEATLVVNGELSGRIIPVQIVYLAAQFLLTRSISELWRPEWLPVLKIRRKKAYV